MHGHGTYSEFVIEYCVNNKSFVFFSDPAVASGSPPTGGDAPQNSTKEGSPSTGKWYYQTICTATLQYYISWKIIS